MTCAKGVRPSLRLDDVARGPHVSAPGRRRRSLVRSALRGCERAQGHAQSNLSHFGFWRVEAQRRGGRDTLHRNYLSERMYECLVCTHPAPLPTWCAILRAFQSRLIAVTRLESGARHDAQPPSKGRAVDLWHLSDAMLGGDALHIRATGRRIVCWCLSLATYTLSIVERLSRLLLRRPLSH